MPVEQIHEHKKRSLLRDKLTHKHLFLLLKKSLSKYLKTLYLILLRTRNWSPRCVVLYLYLVLYYVVVSKALKDFFLEKQLVNDAFSNTSIYLYKHMSTHTNPL